MNGIYFLQALNIPDAYKDQRFDPTVIFLYKTSFVNIVVICSNFSQPHKIFIHDIHLYLSLPT